MALLIVGVYSVFLARRFWRVKTDPKFVLAVFGLILEIILNVFSAVLHRKAAVVCFTVLALLFFSLSVYPFVQYRDERSTLSVEDRLICKIEMLCCLTQGLSSFCSAIGVMTQVPSIIFGISFSILLCLHYFSCPHQTLRGMLIDPDSVSLLDKSGKEHKIVIHDVTRGGSVFRFEDVNIGVTGDEVTEEVVDREEVVVAPETLDEVTEEVVDSEEVVVAPETVVSAYASTNERPQGAVGLMVSNCGDNAHNSNATVSKIHEEVDSSLHRIDT